jgi:hypothetical protein
MSTAESIQTQQEIMQLLATVLAKAEHRAAVLQEAEKVIGAANAQLACIAQSFAANGIEMPRATPIPPNMTSDQLITYSEGVIAQATEQLKTIKAAAAPPQRSWWKRVFG